MPYSSAAPVYAVAGETSPTVFGGNCIDQAEAAKALADSIMGCESRYLRDHRHHAVHVPLEYGALILDPYLLHSSPAFLNGGSKRQHAYPRVDGVEGFVVFRQTGDWIGLEKKVFNPAARAYQTAQFCMSIGSANIERPSRADASIAFAPEQTSLSVRVLDPSIQALIHLVYPVSRLRGEPVREQCLYVKQSGSEVICATDRVRFREATDRLAHLLGCAYLEVIDYLLHAAVLYETHAPQGIRYYSANPTNQ